MMRARHVSYLAVWGVMLGLGQAWADESVVSSKHDLSTFGPGPIRAVNEGQICIFCHAPHNAAPQSPLWNRTNPRTHYRIYSSSTTDARIDQPTGPSKMCLSCHDGTMALGNVLSRPPTHPIVVTARTIPPGTSDLTTDLADDHPIGFKYDRALSNADRQLRAPEVLTPELPLGAHGELHCTTCHDPHNNELGDFLRLTDQQSAICVACHDLRGWQGCAHATSKQRITGRVVDPRERLKYRRVGENGCLSCHKIHGATERERLLRFVREEDNCLNCHSGAVATYNIAADIHKRSGHWVERTTGVHDPAENPFGMRRHVECVDCHNPHAVQHNTFGAVRGTLGQTVKGPLLHATGVAASGRQLDDARFGYEVCFKCHADGLTRPRALASQRQIMQTNVRLEFAASNPSFHPVMAPRRNSDVVSLRAPYRVGALVTCTDCHNSDNSRFAGGTGPNGPHGSIYEPLLVDNYRTEDFTTESADAYSLCYRCHDRDSILGDESFSRHRRHIVDIRTPCSACHDAHGIYRGQGNATNHSHLLNFDLSIVFPADTAAGPTLQYVDTGRFSGTCTMTCHGFPHVNFPYSNSSTAKPSASRARRISGAR